MDSKYTNNCEVLRARFEGKEAIYIEKGALRVRVSNIHTIHAAQGSTIGADVEEIPTPGLGVGLFPPYRPGRSPFRWDIAGIPTSYSDQSWSMGYGGWSLEFDPEFVQAVIDFAGRRAKNADPVEGYSEVCRLLNNRISTLSKPIGKRDTNEGSIIMNKGQLSNLLRKAKQGDAEAQFNLGMLYVRGQNVRRDDTLARQWLEKAANQGNADAQHMLGSHYHINRKGDEDYATARQWYEKAAAQGNSDALNGIAMMYKYGHGVPQDHEQARQWYEKAAAQGNVCANLYVGCLYAHEHGLGQDYTKAREWYEKAAALGNVDAAAFLGELYKLGQGVQQDFVKAWHWFQKAAEQGNERAQVFLGELYAKGQGVPQDDLRAYMWWSLALAQDVCYQQYEATKNRDEVARRMTPAQLAEAKQMTQEYLQTRESKVAEGRS